LIQNAILDCSYRYRYSYSCVSTYNKIKQNIKVVWYKYKRSTVTACTVLKVVQKLN
jgi:hypothetical protein